MKNKYDIMINKKKLQGADANILYNHLSYYDMINYFVDDYILNNDVINYEVDYWELYSGRDYDEEDDYYYDIYQYFMISEDDARRLADNTNEIIYYNSNLNIYLLGVTHFGTSWTYVPSDFKLVKEDNNYNYYKLEG